MLDRGGTMTTVGALLIGATDQLTAAGVPSPAHDAAAVAHVLDRRPPLLGPDGSVSPEQSQRYAALLARRLARVPLQHLTGRAHFRHLDPGGRSGGLRAAAGDRGDDRLGDRPAP